MSERNPYSDLLALHKELRALSERHKDLLKRLVNEFSERYRMPKTHRSRLMRLELENPDVIRNMLLAIKMLEERGITIKRVYGDALYPTFYIETRGSGNPGRLNVEIKRKIGAPRNHWYII